LEQSLHSESKVHVLAEHNRTSLSIPKELSNYSIGKLILIDSEWWFITDNGVYICYVKNNELLIKQHLFSGIFCTAVVKDRDDNYWISTLDSGVFIIPNIHINQLQLPQLLGAPSKTISVPDGKLLIGFKNGKALEYKIQDGTIRNLKTNSSFPVSALFYDSYRKEYLVIQKIDNFRFNANTLEPSSNSNLISVKNLMLIHKDSMMSVSSQHGRVSYYPKAGVDIASYSSIFMEKRGYSCMHDHRTGDRYFGMVDELAVYNTKNKKTIKYKGKNLLAKSIILGKDAGIWVATFSNGIFYIQQDRVVKHYDTNDGLLSDMVEQIALDGIYLWVVTKKGIQKFNTISGSFQNLTRRDGVLSYDISDIIVEKNYVVFSSNDGLFSIDKERAFKKFRPLDVYLTSVEINEQRQEILPFYELERDHSKLRISFNSNGYRGTSSGSYEYRMLGLEKKWNKII
ncbi:MAG: hypothetical protein NWQ09_11920, partial [Nonlabens sp.]|nr:hypothetical protein [Nonlabens sp.]